MQFYSFDVARIVENGKCRSLSFTQVDRQLRMKEERKEERAFLTKNGRCVRQDELATRQVAPAFDSLSRSIDPE